MVSFFEVGFSIPFIIGLARQPESQRKGDDRSIVNDLYYLGEALGDKYAMLRKCYMVFMIGMTLSVMAFALAFWL
ncbi:MAG: hypothetical protein AAFO94_09665, partial [Bacteroidota bacterium]